LATVARGAYKAPALTLVPTKELALALVNTALDTVAPVAVKVPRTSNNELGLAVPIPTFPLAVKRFPIVFDVPTADNAVVAKTVPAETLVLSTLVDVMLTTVNEPATFKFPDKLMFPPDKLATFATPAFNVSALTLVLDTCPLTCTAPPVNIVARAIPATSNGNAGELVLIPTRELPAVPYEIVPVVPFHCDPT
jgi:hypothetical protein